MTEVDPHNEATFKVCVIQSDMQQAEIVKQAVLQEVERCRFRKEARFAIKLALEEALCNAIKHGNKNDPSKNVTVRYAVTPEMAVVIVRDEGGGFIPDNIPDPTSLDRLPLPDGRGILLLRAYMDKVEFRDRGREVYFMKLGTKPGSAGKRARR